MLNQFSTRLIYPTFDVAVQAVVVNMEAGRRACASAHSSAVSADATVPDEVANMSQPLILDAPERSTTSSRVSPESRLSTVQNP